MADESTDVQTDVEAEPAAEANPEELREQMQETRAALTDKLETLEDRVVGTMEAAQTTVQETVEAVKETVQDTVATVKRTFDLKYQVGQRPWLMIGASVLAGYAVGRRWRAGHSAAALNGQGEDASRLPQFRNHREPPSPSPAEHLRPTLPSKLLSQFEEELGKLQSVVIGAGMGMLRNWLKDVAPALAPKLDEVMDSATRKLGGEPDSDPLLSRS